MAVDAAATDLASLTEMVESEAIGRVMTEYQWQPIVAADGFAFRSLAGRSASTQTFPRKEKSASVPAAKAESGTLSVTEFTLSEVTVAVSVVGLAREITREAEEDFLLGPQQLTDMLLDDAAILFGENLDQTAMAEFANASNSVTDSGNALTISDLVDAIAKQRAAKVRGPHRFVLSDTQLQNLQGAQVADTATTWTQFYQPNADGTEFGGFFFGFPIFASNLNPSANSAADKQGALFSEQAGYEAFGYVSKRPLTVEFDTAVKDTTRTMAATSRYGVGTIAANFATVITTDA